MQDIKNNPEEAAETIVAASAGWWPPCGWPTLRTGSGRATSWARPRGVCAGSARSASGQPTAPGTLGTRQVSPSRLATCPATSTCSAAVSQLLGSLRLRARWTKSCSTWAAGATHTAAEDPRIRPCACYRLGGGQQPRQGRAGGRPGQPAAGGSAAPREHLGQAAARRGSPRGKAKAEDGLPGCAAPTLRMRLPARRAPCATRRGLHPPGLSEHRTPVATGTAARPTAAVTSSCVRAGASMRGSTRTPHPVTHAIK